MKILVEVNSHITSLVDTISDNKPFFCVFQNPSLIDPSELLRPELKFVEKSQFRDYSVDDTNPLKERVRLTYRQMHLNQTVDFVKGLSIELSPIPPSDERFTVRFYYLLRREKKNKLAPI